MFRLPILWLGFVSCGAPALGLPWQIDANAKPPHAELAGSHVENRRSAEPLAITGGGAVPAAIASILRNETTLEETGQIHDARRLLKQAASDTTNIELLKRRARLEDYYGASGADAYLALMKALVRNGAPDAEIVEICRRAVVVALRTERYELAKTFADRMATAGDSSGLDLLKSRKSSAESRTTILGGSEALRFLVLGNGKGRPDDILTDYTSALNSLASARKVSGEIPEWKKLAVLWHKLDVVVKNGTASKVRARTGYSLEVAISPQLR